MISVVVVNHNTTPHLLRCLKSLKEERQPPRETFVVDNASANGTLDSLDGHLDDVRLLQLDRNIGYGQALNLAAGEASGELLLFMNADAWLAPGCLTRLAGRLRQQPRSALAAPQLFYPDGRPQFSWFPRTSLFGEALQKLRNRLESRMWAHRGALEAGLAIATRTVFCAACTMVRRSAFEHVGGFDPGFFLYFEDVDLCLRLRRAGWKLGFVPEAKAFHVSGASRHEWWEEVYRRSQLYYYRKHRPAWEARLLLRLLRFKYRRRLKAGDGGERVLRHLDDTSQLGRPQAAPPG